MRRTDLVYKYRSFNTNSYDILISNRIFLSSPLNLNDPFDCQCSFDPDVSDNDLKAWVESEKRKHPDKIEELNAFIAEEGYKDPEFKKGLIAGNEFALSEMGVFSASKKRENLLMWAHYADEFKGFAIGFEVGMLESPSHNLVEVTYSKEFPKVKVTDEIDYQLLLANKFEDWDYEDEVRILKNDGANSFFDLPENCIKEIIIGCRASDSSISTLLNLLDKTNFSGKVYKTIKPFQSYKLEYEQIR